MSHSIQCRHRPRPLQTPGQRRRRRAVREGAAGPFPAGAGETLGGLPRGLYIVDGAPTMEIGPDGRKSVTMAHGSRTHICAQIDRPSGHPRHGPLGAPWPPAKDTR